LQDSNGKHNVSFNNEVSRDASNFMWHDMIYNWKHGHIPPHNCFDFLYFRNPVFRCVVQDHFSSTIGVEDDFSSKGGEWWGHDTRAYDHDWCM
jgi:hypothetical protein